MQVEMPDGLVALGDSVMALNPVHGQGITVSMMGAELLHDVIAKRLAASSPSSNRALALRGLPKVCVMPAQRAGSAGMKCELHLIAQRGLAGVSDQASASAQDAVDPGHRHRPQVCQCMLAACHPVAARLNTAYMKQSTETRRL